MANQPDFSSLETRIKTLESAAGITEARVKELIGAETAVSIKTFLAGDEGKMLIKTEASKTVMEAMAATGTTPNKPSPASAAPPETQAANFEAAGDYEKAFTLLPESERADFLDAKSYAAFQKANRKGAVILNERK